MSEIFGRHYLVDFIGCDAGPLRTVESARPIFLEAARVSNATVVGHRFHQFQPQGVSGVILIAESHLSLHSWPEKGFAAVDIFTCGEEMDPQAAIEHLSSALGARETDIRVLKRGRLGQGEPHRAHLD